MSGWNIKLPAGIEVMNKDYSGGLVPTPEEDIPLVAVESEAYAEFDR
jgi:hypothetical protein